MAKKEKKEKPATGLWDKITDSDFQQEGNIDDVDVGDYNTGTMGLFAFNVNCARQLPTLEDSLIPVQRRILWVAYLMKAYKNNKVKSASLIGQTLNYHPHGNASIYMSMVNMAQPFKKGAPIMRGYGNFGSICDPNTVGADRYTEASISDYGYECFFSEFDPDCIEMQPNATRSADEPVYLPSKFPNILIEGVSGLGYGFNSSIPPYNINDVLEVTKKLILDPEDPEIDILPDPPVDGCEIVFNEGLKSIAETGSGSLTMRAHIEIEEDTNKYVFHIRSIPWLADMQNIGEQIVQQCKAGNLSFHDKSDRTRALAKKSKDEFQKHDIDYCLYLHKAYDPLKEKAKLYKLTDLQKTISVQFWAVTDGVNVNHYNIRTLLLAWIDNRREYIRRLLNKKVSKINARITILETLIKLTEKTNLERVIKIIKGSSQESAEDQLMKLYGMNSFIAHKVVDMPLRAFTGDMHQKYIEERDELAKELKKIMGMIYSEKKIDELIISDLDDLKKYAPPKRYCTIIREGKEEAISDTEHIMVFTKKGFYKKLPTVMNSRVKGYGAMAHGDYPILATRCKNLENIILFDSTGRFSIVPVHEFDNTIPSNTGNRVYDVTKLQGEIITVDHEETAADSKLIYSDFGLVSYIVTLTKSGYLKRTSLEEYRNIKQPKSVRCVKLLKENDSLVAASRLMCYPEEESTKKKPKVRLAPSDLLVYTKKGHFTIVKNQDIPVISRDSQGNRCFNLEEDDSCVGFCILPQACEYVACIMDNGYVKKIAVEEFGDLTKKRVSSYITTMDDKTSLYTVIPINPKSVITVATKNGSQDLSFDEIPTMSRKAKGRKLLSLGGDNIIYVGVTEP